ncbi:MAG TPA: peptidylprolyl isomerase [Xanthomonadaceae bacterium]|nr:peptidylprolyl isomerase [Xanthomonadaceae bacterium]
MRRLVPTALLCALIAPCAAEEPPATPTTAEVLAAASDADWRTLDPDDLLYLDFGGKRVVVELADDFAPAHAANIVALAREHWFDGLAIVRSQDNYVVQWGDPEGDDPERARPMKQARRSLPPEFDRARTGVRITPVPDGDIYAPRAGFASGFPVGWDPASGRVWLAHCYGMVGAGRGDTADSGSGAELYAVIGHAPRHLDRNITLVGRVVHGIEHLATLPRGTGPLGFYEKPDQRVRIDSVRLGSELPGRQRLPLQSLRTDTETFRALIAARRHRRESWFLDPVGRVELCNVPLPVRLAPTGPD